MVPALGAGAQTNVRRRSNWCFILLTFCAGESTGFPMQPTVHVNTTENKGLADNNLQLFHADIAGGDAGMVSVGNDAVQRHG